MTIKEYNKIRSDIFAAAKQNAEIAEELQYGVVYLYEVTQLPDLHKILVLNSKYQMNSLVLRENGFDPSRCSIKQIIMLNPQTKCAYF